MCLLRYAFVLFFALGYDISSFLLQDVRQFVALYNDITPTVSQ
jgi:hypothetical protein